MQQHFYNELVLPLKWQKHYLLYPPSPHSILICNSNINSWYLHKYPASLRNMQYIKMGYLQMHRSCSSVSVVCKWMSRPFRRADLQQITGWQTVRRLNYDRDHQTTAVAPCDMNKDDHWNAGVDKLNTPLYWFFKVISKAYQSMFYKKILFQFCYFKILCLIQCDTCHFLLFVNLWLVITT